MYHQKIESAAAAPAKSPCVDVENTGQRVASKARFYSILIVICLPLILLGLLARFIWDDLKMLARGIAIFHRAAAEELSR